MATLMILVSALWTGLAADLAVDHTMNPVFRELVQVGLRLGGTDVRLPTPILRDGLDANAQQAALLTLAGSERVLADLLRDSVTAPFLFKVHDVKTDDGIVRRLDLWFVAHGDLEKLDPRVIAAEASGQKVGAGNMEFESRLLTVEELKSREKTPLESRELSRWFAHVVCRLLDRIEVAGTSEAVASRTAGSMVIATRTDRAFDAPGPLANRWKRTGNGEIESNRVYGGGGSYTRIDRLVTMRGALLVEMHAAFIEPMAWFEGAPILRSKFAPIAQDQIRRLRRELRKEHAKGTR